MKIKLYIGAHKTATTHMQGLLAANKEILLANNIKLSTPEDLRDKWLPDLLKLSANSSFNNHINDHTKDPKIDIWIIAEENISGIPYDLMTLRGLYPLIEDRLKTLKQEFNKDQFEIFFSIRSYDSFYRSNYLEVIRNRGYTPFLTFYNEKNFQNYSWINVVEMLTNVFPEENITLWCYEEFRSLQTTILKKMTGLDYEQYLSKNYTLKTTRTSLSKKTVEILASLHPAIEKDVLFNLIERINKRYPLNKKNPPYLPFSNTEQIFYKEKYFKDTVEIKRRFKKINFL